MATLLPPYLNFFLTPLQYDWQVLGKPICQTFQKDWLSCPIGNLYNQMKWQIDIDWGKYCDYIHNNESLLYRTMHCFLKIIAMSGCHLVIVQSLTFFHFLLQLRSRYWRGAVRRWVRTRALPASGNSG